METSRERNKQILEARKKGATLAELHEKYDISSARVGEISRREARKESYKSNEVYATLIALCDDEKFVSKTYTVINRLEATTVEAFLSLDEKTVKMARNCGVLMQELIMKMQEELRKKYVS